MWSDTACPLYLLWPDYIESMLEDDTGDIAKQVIRNYSVLRE